MKIFDIDLSLLFNLSHLIDACKTNDDAKVLCLWENYTELNSVRYSTYL